MRSHVYCFNRQQPDEQGTLIRCEHSALGQHAADLIALLATPPAFLPRGTFDPAVLDVLVTLFVDRFVTPITVARMTFAEIGIRQYRMRGGSIAVALAAILVLDGARMLAFSSAVDLSSALFRS